MLESPCHYFFRAMECLGLCPALTLGVSCLGIVECSTYSHPLVARLQTLVLQYPLATISFCLLEHSPISSLLDTNPRQLAQKGIFPDRFIQFHRRFHSHLTQKRHLRTLFVSYLFPQPLLNSQSRGLFIYFFWKTPKTAPSGSFNTAARPN